MRSRLLLLTVCVASLAAAAAATANEPASQPNSEPRSPAAAKLSQCLQTHDRLSVLVLVDQSGSLDETDPENLRVGGLGAALLGLKRLSERLGSRSKVEVLIAGFYYEVVTYPQGQATPSWTEVDDTSIEGLLDEVRKFADLDRHKGRDTDYAAALIGTRELFRQHTKGLADDDHSEPCKALIWFTDGEYQVKPRPPSDPLSKGLPHATKYAPNLRLDRKDVPQDRDGNAVEVERFGKHLLCDSGKTMDDLVRDGVVKFTVALSDASKRTNLTQADKDFLRALTTGAGGSGCGSLLSTQTGQYFDASNGRELLFVLSSLPGPRPPDQPPVPVCPTDPCPEGLSQFRLVDGLGRFIITADTGRDGVEVVLVDPNRGEVRLRPGDPIKVGHSGARITQWWISPRQVVIEGVLPAADAAWQGLWHLAFVHPPAERLGSADHTVQLIADLAPELVGHPQLTRGESTAVMYRLVRRDGGGSATGPLLGAAHLTASVTDSSGQAGPPVTPSGPDDQGTYTAKVQAPDTTAPTADFDVRVDFDESTEIAPVVQSFPLRVRLPKSYPLVSPDRLELGSISGQGGSTSGTLTITGSKTSGGCAWITPPETHAPAAAGKVAFSVDDAASRASCLKVKPGESRQLRVTFVTARRADGSVQSDLPVHLRSDAAAKDETTTVPVAFEVYPTDTRTTILRLVLLMLAGALLPLLILHVLNLIDARFPPEHRVKYLAQDVTYLPGPRFVTADDEAPVTEFGKFAWLSLETGSRKRSLNVDVLDLHTVASASWTDRRFLRLFAGPYGVVTSGDLLILAGSSVPLKELRDGMAHEVPLGLAGTWVFVVEKIHYEDREAATPSQGITKVDGRLVLLIAADGDIDQGERLERDSLAVLATYQWPDGEQASGEPESPSRLDRLRARVPRRTEEETSGKSWLDDGNDSTERER